MKSVRYFTLNFSGFTTAACEKQGYLRLIAGDHVFYTFSRDTLHGVIAAIRAAIRQGMTLPETELLLLSALERGNDFGFRRFRVVPTVDFNPLAFFQIFVALSRSNSVSGRVIPCLIAARIAAITPWRVSREKRSLFHP